MYIYIYIYICIDVNIISYHIIRHGPCPCPCATIFTPTTLHIIPYPKDLIITLEREYVLESILAITSVLNIPSYSWMNFLMLELIYLMIRGYSPKDIVGRTRTRTRPSSSGIYIIYIHTYTYTHIYTYIYTHIYIHIYIHI